MTTHLGDRCIADRAIAVVGGGLAGLTAAATAARAGAAVTVFEAREHPGGRARSLTTATGARFNQGPHALYAGFAGWEVLRGLGIEPRGGRPSVHAWGMLRGRLDRLPGTPIDALRTRLIGTRAKAQLGRLLANPKALLRDDLRRRSFADWIDERLTHPDAVALARMLGRVTTYIDDPATVAAEAAVPQLVGALRDGVRYLDGGWDQLVGALRAAAEDAGAKTRTAGKVHAVRPAGDRWSVEGDDIATEVGAVVIAAGGPGAVASLLGEASPVAAGWVDELAPVHMTSLDLHLARLPRPDRRAAFAVDGPYYLSAHTPAANLCADGEVLHVARYGDAGDDPRAELEAFLDAVQPGWQPEVRAEQYGRRLTVTHGRPDPASGLAGRPGPAVPDCPGVFVAGDWVGGRGMLADAAIASGRDAARLAAVAAAVPA
jgi:phytoene dehydrogenase-like protein